MKAAKATKSAPKSEPKNAGYRVYKVAGSLKKAIAVKRANTDCTNAQLIEAAVTEKLPLILQGLVALGLTAKVGESKKAARWQVSDETLGALKVASAQTGIPATKLLMASLSLLCGTPTKTRKARK